MTLEINIELENMPQVDAALRRFPVELKEDLYSGFLRMSGKEGRILKGTSGFQDRTGRSRRSLFVTATYRPLGLEMGSYLAHMRYLAEGHGTWRGNWWNTYMRGMVPRVAEAVSRTLKRAVDRWNIIYKEV